MQVGLNWPISMRLRVAMRISNAWPDMAKEAAEAAVADKVD